MMMELISDDTGVPAPQVQDLFEHVDIDESVAACESNYSRSKAIPIYPPRRNIGVPSLDAS